MGGPLMDLYGNPLGAVRVLFDKSCRNAASPRDLTRSDWGVQELFQTCLFRENGHLQVPEINSGPVDAIPVNSLVRFRGMVQDMFDVEYYIGAYKDQGVWHTSKYMDTADVPSGPEAEPQMWDRRLFYCVPIPGENSWVKEPHSTRTSTAPSTSTMSQGEKRRRESSNEEESEAMEADAPPSDDGGDNKRLRGDDAVSTSQGVSSAAPDLDLNIPLTSSEGKKLVPCLVKVYDGQDADLKLNDVVEVFGVLTFDPELSAASFHQNGVVNDDMDVVGSAFLDDNVSLRLPASKVPRLQCITLRKISSSDFTSQIPEVAPTVLPLDFAQTRQSLLNYLTFSLGGDTLAAEYLLLHLLSQVHARVDSMALGKLSLNLTGCNPGSEGAPSPMAVAAANVISKLIPRSHLMPLSLETLNKAPIAPRKDYETNRLVTGAIQLADGTHLTLDETALQAGTLGTIGVQNLEVLKHLLQWQKVEYDFQYYKMEMPADVPVLVLSQGKSRILPTDVVLPLNPTASRGPVNITDSDLISWRHYIVKARAMDHSLDESMQKTVENDLVSARQEDRTLGPEIFHRQVITVCDHVICGEHDPQH
ncbi:hypothetical protein M758_11G042700 [Ceratodon purpureus]|nr:hypothetical protein M758_11G042700 [Ceratodon purpureus]